MPKTTKVSNVITTRIIRPNLEDLTPDLRRKLINDISITIAEQIVEQEEFRYRSENILYWQQKIIEWSIEDAVNEINHGNREHRPGNKGS